MIFNETILRRMEATQTEDRDFKNGSKKKMKTIDGKCFLHSNSIIQSSSTNMLTVSLERKL